MTKRRDTEVFSLSFLDCICCGFGAIILLFILSMGVARHQVTDSEEDLEKLLQQKLASLGALTETKERLSGELDRAERSLEDIVTEAASLQALIDELRFKMQNEEGGKKSLLSEVEDLRKEVAAMQKEAPIKQLDATTPIGVPVESNYVAFVIDTSGSMRDPATDQLWPYVIRKFSEVIAVYPEVKAVQFLDADGRFILGRGNDWIPDSPAIRQALLDAVRRYQIFSNSNPVPGIVRAIRTLHEPTNANMRMGIYVFGDEFTDTSDAVLDRIDKLNPPDSKGKRPISINGIGFPNLLRSDFSLGQSGVKFANLMRELTQRHDGAFIAVTD